MSGKMSFRINKIKKTKDTYIRRLVIAKGLLSLASPIILSSIYNLQATDK